MKIYVQYPEKPQQEFELDKAVIKVGRSATSDIQIESDTVSRNHLEIKRESGKVYIKDVSLSNWVSYNDDKLSKEEDTEYFDFAALILPGNVELKIELTQEDLNSMSAKQKAAAKVEPKENVTKSGVKARASAKTKIIEKKDKPKAPPVESNEQADMKKKIQMVLLVIIAAGIGYLLMME